MGQTQRIPERPSVFEGLQAGRQGLVDVPEQPQNERAMAESVDLRIVHVDEHGPTIFPEVTQGLALIEVTERRQELATEEMGHPERVVSLEAHETILARLGNRPVALGELESAIELGTHGV
jgi:hypothetical protein